MTDRIGESGRISEKRLAKKLGGRLRPASGALQGAKGDMTLGNVLIEAKSTVGRSFSVKHEQLAKIAKEARDQGMIPALSISFINGDGRPVPAGEWVAVPLHVWQMLLEEKDE